MCTKLFLWFKCILSNRVGFHLRFVCVACYHIQYDVQEVSRLTRCKDLQPRPHEKEEKNNPQ